MNVLSRSSWAIQPLSRPGTLGVYWSASVPSRNSERRLEAASGFVIVAS